MVLGFICRMKWVIRCFDTDDLSKESMFDQSQIRKFIKLRMLSMYLWPVYCVQIVSAGNNYLIK